MWDPGVSKTFNLTYASNYLLCMAGVSSENIYGAIYLGMVSTGINAGSDSLITTILNQNESGEPPFTITWNNTVTLTLQMKAGAWKTAALCKL